MALPFAVKRDIEQLSFRAYVTDTLQVIAENTAIEANKFLEKPVGKTMTRRWADLDKPAPPEETRTAEEVIEHIKERLKSL